MFSTAGALQIHITEERKHSTGFYPDRHIHTYTKIETDSGSFLFMSLVIHFLNSFEQFEFLVYERNIMIIADTCEIVPALKLTKCLLVMDFFSGFYAHKCCVY